MKYCALLRRTLLLVFMVGVHTTVSARSAMRIIGGREALQDEFPYVVRLDFVLPVSLNISVSKQNRTLTLCSASVLTKTWTLTAAHCVDMLDQLSLYHDGISKNLIGSQHNKDLFEILSQYKHPAYKELTRNGLLFVENDIGMLKTEPILLQKYGKVSAVDFAAVKGQAAITVGYGVSTIMTIDKLMNSMQSHVTLNVLDVVVVQCDKNWHLYPAMCVAHRCESSGTLCPGDSGGPLIHPSGIIAVSTVGAVMDCTLKAEDRSRLVGMMTAISPHITWITSFVTSGE